MYTIEYQFMVRGIRFIVAYMVCLPALFLPYRPRVAYFYLVSEVVHLPFRVFGKIGRFLLKATDTENPYEERGP